jgi:hypothetical protein
MAKVPRNAPALPEGWNQLVIGEPPSADLGDLVPADHQTGGYYGAGTEANTGKFNSKTNVPIDAEMTVLLNELLADRLSDNAAGGGNIGLYDGLAEGWVPFTQITHYSPDTLASISVLNPAIFQGVTNFADVATYFLPGSDDAVANLQNGGPAIGIVTVASPAGRGRPAVGGRAWQKIMQQYLDGAAFDEMLIRHFFAQAGVYGLGDVFNSHGISINAIQVGSPEDEGYHVLYTPVFGTDSGMEGDVPITGWLREHLRLAPGVLHDIAQQHAAKLKSPDMQKLGRYGAANSALRHMGEGDSVEADVEGIRDAMARGESPRGLFTYRQGFRTPAERRGSSSPMRSPTGEAIYSGDKNAGYCNVYAGLPGHTGQAREGYDGYNFYHKGKTYADGTTSYRCGATPGYVINRHRAIYQPGGARGGNIGLTAALERAGVNPQELDQEYENWTNNPEAYGTAKTLVIPGVGFSRGALQQQGLKEQYAGVDLNLLHRQGKGRRALNALGLTGRGQ